jgi:hypothetical protein
MPQRGPWDNEKKEGNPTRATSINNFIRRIRKLEGGVLDEGKVSSSKKRRKSEPPILQSSKKSPITLPTAPSTAKKARVVDVEQPTTAIPVVTNNNNNNVGRPNSNAIISNIIQKMQLQNSSIVDFLGTLGTSIDRFRSTMRVIKRSWLIFICSIVLYSNNRIHLSLLHL